MHGRRYVDALLRGAAAPLALWASRRRDAVDQVAHAALDVSTLRAAFDAAYAGRTPASRTRGETYFHAAYRAGQDGRPYSEVAPYALLMFLDAGIDALDVYNKGATRAGREIYVPQVAEPQPPVYTEGGGSPMQTAAVSFLPQILTTTTWTMLDEGRPFHARYPGTDLISGLPFNAGAEVRSATVNGVKGYVSTAGLRLLDVRYAGDARSTSIYTIVTPDVDTDALIDRAQRVQLLNKQGGFSTYALEPYGWVSTRGSPTTVTPAQIKRYARNAYAISVSGRA